MQKHKAFKSRCEINIHLDTCGKVRRDPGTPALASGGRAGDRSVGGRRARRNAHGRRRVGPRLPLCESAPRRGNPTPTHKRSRSCAVTHRLASAGRAGERTGQSSGKSDLVRSRSCILVRVRPSDASQRTMNNAVIPYNTYGITYVRRSRPPTPDRIFEGTWAVQLQETATKITVTATRKRRKARLLSRLSRLGLRMDTAHHGRLGSR